MHRDIQALEAKLGEQPGYLTSQLPAYLGNKRALLGQLYEAVDFVKRKLGRAKLRCFDVFSGSGSVSRLLKSQASWLASNDLEGYAAALGRCYLANRRNVDAARLAEAVGRLNRDVLAAPLPPGFIELMYAPADERHIKPSDRVFYTRENARRLDNYRRLIDTCDPDLRPFLLGPLLVKAAVHTNTGGVFKGFYRDRHTGVGKFGGTAGHALGRITRRIELEPPVFSRFECDTQILQLDANQAARVVKDVDLAYLDPPYSAAPYGSNYFMLNLLTDYRAPADVTAKSGIPKDWRRSGYNSKSAAPGLLADLLDRLEAKFLLISYNNEGLLSLDQLTGLLAKYDLVLHLETGYATYRACRNLRQRPGRTSEHLFVVKKA